MKRIASAFPVGLPRGQRANREKQFLMLRYPAVSAAGSFIIAAGASSKVSDFRKKCSVTHKNVLYFRNKN
jgi:hypothetical protein